MDDPSPAADRLDGDYSHVHLAQSSLHSEQPHAAEADAGSAMLELGRLTRLVERVAEDVASIKRHLNIH